MRSPCAADEYAERVAALLYVWIMLAWLLPTLLLLPRERRPEAARSISGELRRSSRLSSSEGRHGGDDGGRGSSGSSSQHSSGTRPQNPSAQQSAVWLTSQVAASIESKLRLLKCSSAAAAGGGGGGLRQNGLCLLRWGATLVIVWEACCLLAPFYTAPAD